MTVLDPGLIAELKTMDTPTVCNALELLAPKRRGYGYTVEPLVCLRPAAGPIVGVARTATIRSAHPSDLNLFSFVNWLQSCREPIQYHLAPFVQPHHPP